MISSYLLDPDKPAENNFLFHVSPQEEHSIPEEEGIVNLPLEGNLK